MGIEIWILIIAGAVIWFLAVANRDKAKDVENIRSHWLSSDEKLKKEIETHKKTIADQKETIKKQSQDQAQRTREYQAAIMAEQVKNEETYQQYISLMRAYMIARKKNQVEIVEEIEKSISVDYEELGSKNIPASNYVASLMADFYTLQIKDAGQKLRWMKQQSRATRIDEVRSNAQSVISRAKSSQYAFEFALSRVLKEHPEIHADYIKKRYGISLSDAVSSEWRDANKEASYLQEISSLKTKCEELEGKVRSYEAYTDIRWPLLRDSVIDYQKEFSSNLTAIPYMSRIIADIMTIDLNRLAWSLSWGNNQERKKKVASLTALKKEKAEEIERIKGAEYQLAYLLELYPVLQDVIDAEFSELSIDYDQVEDFDPVRRYIDREEWSKLTTTERNQRALDRYIESRRKSKWQIGRDYELYCGYCYEQQGFTVDYYGSFHGLEDLGRDLIVKQGSDIRIVQCKYWSKTKQIHENHIMQLYGSVVEYNLENNGTATGILITNTVLSEKAKQFAQILGIAYKENLQLGEFPRIKCNIGVGESGERTKIYHLPFDQQYDTTKVDGKDEFMALTVAEAEQAGFRRAYKWHSN